MTFTAVGSLQNAENAVTSTSTTFSLTTTTVGDFILAQFCCNTSYASVVTSTRCTWTQLAPVTGAQAFTFSSPFNSNIWIGQVNSTGTDTVSVTFNASMGGANCRFDAQEFHSSVGGVYLDTFGVLNNPSGTNTWPTLTPSGTGELYWGWSEDSGSAVSGSTSGFVYTIDSHSNGAGYCLSVSSAYTPVWGDSGQVAGLMALLREPTSLTVTATQGGGAAPGMLLRVKVLTGAAPASAQTGAALTATFANSGSITTTHADSFVYGAIQAAAPGSFTAEPLCTLIDNFNETTHSEQYGTFRTTSATGTPGATLVGSSTGDTSISDIAAAEILAGGTIAEDSSAPAVVTSGTLTALTTASFSPPPGSLLVVMVACNGSAASLETMTVTGGGLTWTPLAQAATSSTCYAGVFIAQVPGVVFDAVGPSASGASSSTSPLTWSHTCGAGATELLVGVTVDLSAGSAFTAAVTYNGVAMTSLGQLSTDNSDVGYLQVFSLPNPPTGSAFTVSVTATGSGTLAGVNGGSISLTGSSQLSAIQPAFGNGTTISESFTGTTFGNVVVAFAGCGSNMTPSGSFTSRFNNTNGDGNNGGSGAGWAAGSTIASPGGSVTPSWTNPGDFWAIIAVEVQVGGASASPVFTGIGRAQFSPSHLARYGHGHFGPEPRQAAAGFSAGYVPRQYTETLAALLAISAGAQNRAGRVVTSLMATSGVTSRAASRVLTAVMAAVVAVARRGGRTAAGGLAAAASTGRGVSRALGAAGALTGAAGRSCGRVMSATAAGASSIVRGLGRSLAGSAGVTGLTGRSLTRTFTTVIAVTASASATKVKLVTLAAVTAVKTAATRQAGRFLGSPTAVSSGVVRRAGRVCSAAVAGFPGVIRGVTRTVLIPLAASASAATSSAVTHFLTVAGNLAVSAATRNFISKIITGEITVIPGAVRKISRTTAATAGVTAGVIRNAGRSFIVIVAMTGSQSAIKVRLILFQTAVVVNGTITRRVLPNLVTVIIMGGVVTRSVSRAIQGTFAVAGQTLRRAGRVLPTVIVATMTFTRQPQKLLNASVAVAGSFTRKLGKIISGVAPVTPGFSRRAAVHLTFAAKTAVTAVFSSGRPYFMTLTAKFTVTSSVVTRFVNGGREIIVKYGIVTFNWVTGAVAKRWKAN